MTLGRRRLVDNETIYKPGPAFPSGVEHHPPSLALLASQPHVVEASESSANRVAVDPEHARDLSGAEMGFS
jgi:hypothetical protein